MFKILLSSPAGRFLKRCEKETCDRLLSKIKHLASDPFPSDSKRVVGRKEKTFRVKVGDYRILYVVFMTKVKS